MSTTPIIRRTWGAASSTPMQPGTDQVRRRMALPVKRVNLHHSVTRVTSDPFADMRAIELVGMQRFGIFSYSYALHPELDVAMEGCGLHVGAHTAGFNSTEFGVVLIGNYDQRDITDKQVTAFSRLMEHLTEVDALAPAWTLRGHRDTKATACPGGKAYPRLAELHHAATAVRSTPTKPTNPTTPGGPTVSAVEAKTLDDKIDREVDGLKARDSMVYEGTKQALAKQQAFNKILVQFLKDQVAVPNAAVAELEAQMADLAAEVDALAPPK